MDKKKGCVRIRELTLVILVLVLTACSSLNSRYANDLDRDAVVNAQDACPDTIAGMPVDEVGCGLFSGQIQNVDFGPGDHRLNGTSRESLTELVELLNAHPEIVVRLGGHTDNQGLAKNNLALSKRRVMSVVKFLVANGVDGMRLQPFGFGESQPIASNSTETGRASNRRIEMSVVIP